jgi:signal transduction histidine kinase
VVPFIFDPFFTTKGRDRGTGLGLAVSHGILKEHDGDLRLENHPGEGATFHIELPTRT